jgi:hypothetical protein
MVAFMTTESLSTKTFARPSRGTPSIHNLYRRPLIISVAIHSATNSELKVELPLVFCVFEYHRNGARFK